MISLRAKRITAWIVWSASALLVIALLVGLLAWFAIATQRASDRRDAQIAALVQSVTDHEHDAAADRRTAAANQKALLDYTAALAARQDALLTYLRTHGIRLPERLVTVIPPPRIVVRHAGHHHATRKHSRSTRTATAPTGPGKSGRAPGHRKHHR